MSMGLARALDGLDDLHKEADAFLKAYAKDPLSASEEDRSAFDRMVFNGSVEVRLGLLRDTYGNTLTCSLKGVRRQDRLRTLLMKIREKRPSNMAYFLHSWGLCPIWKPEQEVFRLHPPQPPTTLLIPGDNLMSLVDLGLFDAPLPHEVEELIALLLPEGCELKGLAAKAIELYLSDDPSSLTQEWPYEVQKEGAAWVRLMGYCFHWNTESKVLTVLTNVNPDPNHALGKVKAKSLQKIDLTKGILASF